MYVGKNILVTGCNGFVGQHLVRTLKSSGYDVLGLSSQEAATPQITSLLAGYVQCDLTNDKSVSGLPLASVDAVINLAALAYVGASFDSPRIYMEVNVGVLTNLGQTLLKKNPAARLVAISTGAVYDSRQPLPLTEQSRLITSGSPYALSKLAMEKAVNQLSTRGLNCVIARPFNHIGPGQRTGFLVPDLYEKLRAFKAHGGTIKVGDLTTKRDYTDVRDVAKAYVLLATSEPKKIKHPVYNICSGASHSGQEILDQLQKLIPGRSGIKVTLDPALMRPNDPKNLVGSSDRLHKDLGWKPDIPLEQTIADFAASWQD
jgi:GDP-4-dehydro-6-deoxy-D-mannose reductase